MSESRLSKLRALEAMTASSIAETPADKRAPLINQLRGILSEIEELERSEQKVGDPIDEIAARRAARGASASSVSRRARAN